MISIVLDLLCNFDWFWIQWCFVLNPKQYSISSMDTTHHTYYSLIAAERVESNWFLCLPFGTWVNMNNLTPDTRTCAHALKCQRKSLRCRRLRHQISVTVIFLSLNIRTALASDTPQGSPSLPSEWIASVFSSLSVFSVHCLTVILDRFHRTSWPNSAFSISIRVNEKETINTEHFTWIP